MRMTPSMRPRAEQLDKHHMLWRRKDWINESVTHRKARESSAYKLILPRAWHDILHVVVDRVLVPSLEVADAMVQIGESHSEWKTSSRIPYMLDAMAGFAMAHPSPEKSDEMLTIMGSLSAQVGFLAMEQSMLARFR